MMRTLLSALALALLAVSAEAQLTHDDCLACHDTVDAAKYAASVHASSSCTDCHASITGPGPHENVQKPDCSTCHADAVAQYASSAHATAKTPGAPGCVQCHGKHDILPRSDPKSPVNRFNIPRTCATCHANAVMVKGHRVPPPEKINEYFAGVHGKGTLEKGLNVSAVCSDCHGGHAVLAKSNPASTISHQNVPNTCRKCHEGIFNAWQNSSHGQLWSKGDPKGPVCVNCHGEHAIQGTETSEFRGGLVVECAKCHDHEAPTYRDSFHGQATNLGYDPAAKCSDCHTAHLNLPETDPRASIAPHNLEKTCGKCHDNTNANFATFQPHADPHNKESSPQLYYVYNYMMKWLLLGVFGFFGLHTLLWLQRSIVAAFRGELPKHSATGTQWVRRFARRHRLTHIAVVVSFLALAATGLPLMYAHTEWGKTVASLFGGVGGSTFIHRLFAIVTFGYALYHLALVLHGLFVKRDRTMFSGPNSMMPRVRDLTDLWNMLKWFLYFGKRPRFDRFTYWEKFDYFAVFWGVPVIGLSGLMLWIPQLVTKVLPGWALNVAMLVHGDEALLAIGFIFTFHFFHTHLRPEAFPLDPVMFTGRMTLERFRDERPDEYERLMRENKLDTVLTGPPTRGQILFSRIFGFTTVSIGVVLIVAIYITFVGRFTN